MNKQEFINTLRISLSKLEDVDYLNETVSYYENYIETEIRKGKTEEEVIRSLGDPRLIAKSVISSRQVAEESNDSGSEDRDFENAPYDGYGKKVSFLFKVIRYWTALPIWLRWLLGCVLFVVVVFLFMEIAPYLILGLAIVWVVKYISKIWKN